MLRVNRVSKTFNRDGINEQRVFDNFSMDIDEEDFICVLGSNGAGKSTLLNIISGKVQVDGGSIILKNRDVTDDAEHEKCKNISRIFQDPSLGTNPSMTIYENLSMAKNKGNSFGLSFLINRKDEEYFKELLRPLKLGLEDKLHALVSQLSGGQRQSLALIMAVIGEPDLLLLDEHTAALDPKTSEIVMGITEDIVEEKGLTTIMVTHNVDHAIRYGNRLIMLHRGNKIVDIVGEEKSTLTKEKLLALFKDADDKSLFS
ncbi:MAG: ATP-binding cassette domain-containing protein [Tissierellia bacterium]|nr:ATP-binding cassette domain-containing protein [Tissierellia bacterium]